MPNKFSYRFFHSHEIDFPIGRWDSKQVTVAGRISRPVDFSMMKYFLDYLDLITLLVYETFTWIIKWITLSLMWNLDLNFKQTALISLGRVWGQESEVIGMVLLDFDLREPLEWVGWDVQGVKNYKVVGLRCLLFPKLVLLVYYHLLFLVEL